MSTRLTSTTYSSSRAVVHCDVDCFYCQVETLDNPALIGRPLAVHQGNSGGFVAVNYEVCTVKTALQCKPGCNAIVTPCHLHKKLQPQLRRNSWLDVPELECV